MDVLELGLHLLLGDLPCLEHVLEVSFHEPQLVVHLLELGVVLLLLLELLYHFISIQLF